LLLKLDRQFRRVEGELHALDHRRRAAHSVAAGILDEGCRRLIHLLLVVALVVIVVRLLAGRRI
jgi:hypothetical protein